VFGKDFGEDEVYQIGRCIPFTLGSKNLVVGRDMRNSSEVIFTSLVRGILDGGGEVKDIGLQETPGLYFAVERLGADGGIMITASHNPPEYNGLKIVEAGAVPVDQENGLLAIAECLESPPTISVDSFNNFASTRREIKRVDVNEDYLRFLRSFIEDVGDYRVIIDCSNGMAGQVAGSLFYNTELDLELLNKVPDGSFPVHGPNPMIDANLELLKSRVLRSSADLGVCFDGDGDRVIFVDAEGNTVSPDIITALLAKHLLDSGEDKEQPILYDLRSSKSVSEYIHRNGGKAEMSPIGHSRVKRLMRARSALLGGELTGHYYYKCNNYADSGWLSVIYLLSLMRTAGKSLSELAAGVGTYFFSGELNYRVKNKQKIISSLKDKYCDGRLNTMDGVRIEYSDWWFIVRLSTTEPYLRLVIEAKEQDLLKRYKQELESHILSYGSG